MKFGPLIHLAENRIHITDATERRWPYYFYSFESLNTQKTSTRIRIWTKQSQYSMHYCSSYRLLLNALHQTSRRPWTPERNHLVNSWHSARDFDESQQMWIGFFIHFQAPSKAHKDHLRPGNVHSSLRASSNLQTDTDARTQQTCASSPVKRWIS